MRELRFDPYYKNCKLLYKETFFVRKTRIPSNPPYYHYFAVLDQNDFHGSDSTHASRWISQLKCLKGLMNWMKTADETETGVNIPAFQCGLATLLTYLCIKDDDIHGKKGYDDWNELERFGKAGQEIKKNTKHFCKKIIHLVNTAKGPTGKNLPANAGKAYLYAARDAGYERFFTLNSHYDKSDDCEPEAHNFKIYDVLRDLIWVDDNNLKKFKEDHGDRWYFCAP